MSLVSAPQFTVNNFSDEQATKIIWYLMQDAKSRSICDKEAPGWLPQIPFAAGEMPVDVTNIKANDTNQVRIINCGNSTIPNALQVPYSSAEEQQRVEKYQVAAELNETGTLGKDCSSSGCPGVNINGQSGLTYHASYGRSQFIGSTFLETVNKLDASEKFAIGITPEIQMRIDAARARSSTAAGAFNSYRKRYTCATAPDAWDRAGQATMPNTSAPMSTAERDKFLASGLNRQAFIDMVCFVKAPPARPLGEAREAFATEAIFSDTVLKDWMMGVFKSGQGGAFDYISRVLIRKNLRDVLNAPNLSGRFQNAETAALPNGQPNPAYAQRQRQIEEELAMRTARRHNGDKANTALSPDVSVLTRACTDQNKPRCDVGDYVHKFIGLTAGHGDWRSLRCADSSARNDWRGLQMQPLKLK
ncbi:MAG: hypothetical protein ACYC3N_10620 [Halothiobacillus sp.]